MCAQSNGKTNRCAPIVYFSVGKVYGVLQRGHTTLSTTSPYASQSFFSQLGQRTSCFSSSICFASSTIMHLLT